MVIADCDAALPQHRRSVMRNHHHVGMSLLMLGVMIVALIAVIPTVRAAPADGTGPADSATPTASATPGDPKSISPQTAAAGPAIVHWNGVAYIGWTGTNGAHNLNVMTF